MAVYDWLGGARLRAPGKMLCWAWPRRGTGIRPVAGGVLPRATNDTLPGRAGHVKYFNAEFFELFC